MLHLLLAALQITWSGAGHPHAHSDRAVPVVIVQLPEARVPAPPTKLQAYDGAQQVVAEYSVTPANAAVFSSTDPAYPYGYADDSYVFPGKHYHGAATIHARYRGMMTDASAYVYDALAVSCYLNFPNGVAFDASGIAQIAGTPQESDIYQAGPENTPPADIFRGCTGAFIDGAQTTYPLHLPYGATLIPYTSGAYVGDVSVRQWRNDFTIAPALHAGDILLFRTAKGNLVKLLVSPVTGGALTGAYAVAPARQEFADYAALHPQPRRRKR